MSQLKEQNPERPSQRRVASRALVLAAVAARGLIEKDGPPEEYEADRKEIISWIEAVGISDELEPDEWKVLQLPVGSLERQAMVDATWRTEGLAVLLWALRRMELSPYDQQVNPGELFGTIGYWDENAGHEFLNSAEIRSLEELLALQTTLLALHWRLVEFSLRPEPLDFRKFARDGWMGPFDLTPFHLIDDDLSMGHFAISKAPMEMVKSVRSCANERHLAINWLMGYSQIYSETDTST